MIFTSFLIWHSARKKWCEKKYRKFACSSGTSRNTFNFIEQTGGWAEQFIRRCGSVKPKTGKQSVSSYISAKRKDLIVAQMKKKPNHMFRCRSLHFTRVSQRSP